MQKKKSTHLTADDRIRIEALLHEACSLRYIADRLDKSPSTISREISKHTQTHTPKCCDCLNSPDCTLHHVCGSSGCRKKCKACHKAKSYCNDYVKAQCDSLLNSPIHLCNSCHKQRYCHFEKHLYDGRTADREYRSTLVNSRNGLDIEGMERSIYGGQRTCVFFCEPNRSDQKAECENNHRLLRDIIPKGTSLKHFMQADMTLAANHINSYVRKSLFGRCPYDLAMAVLPEDFFLLPGLEHIPAGEVIMKPSLLKRMDPSK